MTRRRKERFFFTVYTVFGFCFLSLFFFETSQTVFTFLNLISFLELFNFLNIRNMFKDLTSNNYVNQTLFFFLS